MVIESGTCDPTNVERVTYPLCYTQSLPFFIIKKLGLNRLKTKCLTRFVVLEKISFSKKSQFSLQSEHTKENDDFNKRFQVLLGVIIIVLQINPERNGGDRRVGGQEELQIR